MKAITATYKPPIGASPARITMRAESITRRYSIPPELDFTEVYKHALRLFLRDAGWQSPVMHEGTLPDGKTRVYVFPEPVVTHVPQINTSPVPFST